MRSFQLTTPIKVWYKSLPVNPRIPWPILDVRMSYKNKAFPQSVLALIDSGASYSILHPQLAQFLGFDLQKSGRPQNFGKSASGNYQSWLLPDPIKVDIFGYSFNFRFEVIDNPRLIWPCILGENSIFEVSRIDFLKFRGFLELRFREDMN